jgi:hypothetical protein
MTPDPTKSSLDQAFDALRRMEAPERPSDSELLARLAAGLSPAAHPVSTSRRRVLMRLTKLSLAASVLVAAAGVLFMGGFPMPALGDVLEAAGKHKLVKYKLTQADENKEGSTAIPLVQAAYADLRAPRFRLETRDAGSLSGAIDFECVFVRDTRKDLCVRTITESITDRGKSDPKLVAILKDFEKMGCPRKEVVITKAYGDFTPATAEQNRSILENIRELEKHKDAIASKGKLDGKEVLKYRVEEKYKTTVLWVDAVTKLPVKLEHELTDPKIMHPSVSCMKFTLTEFEWDPELKGFKNLDELFDTIPLKGYKVEDLRENKNEKQDK